MSEQHEAVFGLKKLPENTPGWKPKPFTESELELANHLINDVVLGCNSAEDIVGELKKLEEMREIISTRMFAYINNRVIEKLKSPEYHNVAEQNKK